MPVLPIKNPDEPHKKLASKLDLAEHVDLRSFTTRRQAPSDDFDQVFRGGFFLRPSRKSIPQAPKALHPLGAAQYANLEFEPGKKNGQSGGIPGGHGSVNLGATGQSLYLLATAIGFIGPGKIVKALKSGLKSLFKLGVRGVLGLTRKLVARATGRLGGRLLGERAARIAGMDFVEGVGRLGGKLFPKSRLKVLARYLEKRGFKLKVGDKFLGSNIAGGFNSATREVVLRSNPTMYEVWHEMAHYVQHKKLGPSAYQALSRVAKEQFVFDTLQNSLTRWERLTYEQQQHAITYILQVGGIR